MVNDVNVSEIVRTVYTRPARLNKVQKSLKETLTPSMYSEMAGNILDILMRDLAVR